MSVGHDLVSHTVGVNHAILDPIPGHPNLRGRRLVILDTPGLNDTWGGNVSPVGGIRGWAKS